MWWPAIGGVAVGLGGLIEPRALGVGYDVIRQLLQGGLVGPALVSLLVAKALMWSLSLGSGTSGGVLAPLLMMGGMLGALETHIIPNGIGDAGLWAAVSMAAMMGGTMRSPFTAAIFALELTHDVNAAPAVFIGAIAALAVTVLMLKRSILTEKIARRGYHINREYSVDPYETMRVADVMDRDITTYPCWHRVADIAHIISERVPEYRRHHAVPLADVGGNLVGVITRDDILRGLDRPDGAEETVLQAGSDKPVLAHPDELIRDAVERMLEHSVGRLLVVDRDNPHRLVGYLGRPGILEARLHRIEEETVRENRRHASINHSR